MPPWGRPSGALTGTEGGAKRRRAREPRRPLDNDSGDEGLVEPFMSRPEFIGDELMFTGYDLGSARRYSRAEDYSDDEDRYEYEKRRYEAYLAAREESLVQSAQERMRKARKAGKSRASLSPEEVDALERRRQQQESRPVSKGRTSRSNSAVNLIADKEKEKSRKKSKSFFSSPVANSSRSRTPKEKPRKVLKTPSYPAPGFMVAGPDGRPMYAPFGYYPPERPHSSRASSGSASSSSKPRTPPYDTPYPPYPPRYYLSLIHI